MKVILKNSSLVFSAKKTLSPIATASSTVSAVNGSTASTGKLLVDTLFATEGGTSALLGKYMKITLTTEKAMTASARFSSSLIDTDDVQVKPANSNNDYNTDMGISLAAGATTGSVYYHFSDKFIKSITYSSSVVWAEESQTVTFKFDVYDEDPS